MTRCDTADRCVFDPACQNCLNCVQVDPQGLEIMELTDRVAALELRLTKLEGKKTDTGCVTSRGTRSAAIDQDAEDAAAFDRGYAGEARRQAAHNADYVLEPIGERCGARNGDLVCILSKGHTKPVDHWNGTFGFDAAPFHTCEIGVPDADHPLRTDSDHCGECAPQCDLFPGQTCTAVPQKCRTFCERR